MEAKAWADYAGSLGVELADERAAHAATRARANTLRAAGALAEARLRAFRATGRHRPARLARRLDRLRGRG